MKKCLVERFNWHELILDLDEKYEVSHSIASSFISIISYLEADNELWEIVKQLITLPKSKSGELSVVKWNVSSLEFSPRHWTTNLWVFLSSLGWREWNHLELRAISRKCFKCNRQLERYQISISKLDPILVKLLQICIQRWRKASYYFAWRPIGDDWSEIVNRFLSICVWACEWEDETRMKSIPTHLQANWQTAHQESSIDCQHRDVFLATFRHPLDCPSFDSMRSSSKKMSYSFFQRRGFVVYSKLCAN